MSSNLAQFTLALLLALLSVVASTAQAQPRQPDRPVVFVPGILGSKLCEQDTGKTIWGDRWSLSNVAQLALPVDHEAAPPRHVPCGLIETVNILGPFQIHQYDDLLRTFSDLGYEAGKTLLVFPYDWRLSNRHNARLLQAFIAEKLPAGQFDMVVHSMGGLVAKIWMNENAGGARIGTFVTLGTPYLGSANTFKTLDEGWGFWGNLAAKGLKNIRESALSWPSLYELLPTYQRCCGFQASSAGPPAFFDPLTAVNWSRFQWMPASFKTPERQKWLESVLAIARDISKLEIPQGPMVVPIVNGLIPTAWRVVFDNNNGRVIQYILQPGDGTVYQNSAANNRLVDARPALTSHQTIFADDAARQVIRWVLTKGPEPTRGTLTGIMASLRTADEKLVSITSASVEVVPSVLGKGQDAEIVVELTGDPDLDAADLKNLTIVMDGAPLSAVPRRQLSKPTPDSSIVRLTYPIKAPLSPGAFLVTARLPGVADLPDIALVVP
jgi:pimeloyl-ACP methyl ester carboxylesterase